MASRSDSVVVALRDEILAGAFPGGFHLQEVPLAERMGVSRTPIREALTTLAKEGLLEPGPKRGYKVRNFSVDDILEAYDVRATLEGMACRLLAERGVPEKIDQAIRACLETGDRMLEAGMFTELEHDAWLEMNNGYHTNIVEGAGNRILARLIQQTHQIPLASSRHVHWYRLDRENFGLAQKAHEAHHAVFEAIVARQAGRAEALMREHIYFSQSLVKRHLTEALSESQPPAGGNTVHQLRK